LFYTAGTYNVTLTIHNSAGSDGISKSIIITTTTDDDVFGGVDMDANESLAIIILVSGALFLFVLAMMYRRR
jgi:PKD repeat protein